MKLALAFSILISYMVLKNNQRDFYHKITNDFRDNSYFILIKLKNNRKYVIENDDLFLYYWRTKKYSREQYIKEIKSMLSEHAVVEIDKITSSFIKAPNLRIVNSYAKKGIDKFIDTYFDNRKTLKNGITDDERIAIIQKLFEWKIASYIDDETGYLVLSK